MYMLLQVCYLITVHAVNMVMSLLFMNEQVCCVYMVYVHVTSP